MSIVVKFVAKYRYLIIVALTILLLSIGIIESIVTAVLIATALVIGLLLLSDRSPPPQRDEDSTPN